VRRASYVSGVACTTRTHRTGIPGIYQYRVFLRGFLSGGHLCKIPEVVSKALRLHCVSLVRPGLGDPRRFLREELGFGIHRAGLLMSRGSLVDEYGSDSPDVDTKKGLPDHMQPSLHLHTAQLRSDVFRIVGGS